MELLTAGIEQRSTLPNGWNWKRMSDVCQINPPMEKPRHVSGDTEISFVPMSAVDDKEGVIKAPERRKIEEIWQGYKRFQDGDVIFARITPCMENGKAAVANGLINGIACGSTEFHILRANPDEVIPEWLYYFVRQQRFREDAAANFSGTAGQLRVSASFLEQKLIPVPSVPEQNRLVSRIEETLQQIRTARAALDRIPELLTAFRQSVLAAAFRGEFIKCDPNDEPASILLERICAERRWRWEGNLREKGKDPAKSIYEEPSAPDTAYLPELPEGWVWTTLDHLLGKIEAGHSFKAQGRPAEEGEFGVIKVSAMTWGKFLPEENKALLPGTDPSSTPKVCKGDLLISRANTVELVGAVVLVEQDYPNLLLSDKSLRLVPLSTEISKEFLLYALRTQPVRNVFEGEATGVSESMRNISQDKIRIAPIALPPLSEQARIIDRIKRANTKCNQIEQAIETGFRRLDALEQAALSKAFRGGLA